MKLDYDYGKSLLLINKNLTKEIFIDRAGVKDGYSLNMFSRIYDSVTSGLIDVEREYEKYYSFEYGNIEQFLYKKYNLKINDIELLMKIRKENPDFILFRKDDNSYGDYGISQFTFSEIMYDRIMSILTFKNSTK